MKWQYQGFRQGNSKLPWPTAVPERLLRKPKSLEALEMSHLAVSLLLGIYL